MLTIVIVQNSCSLSQVRALCVDKILAQRLIAQTCGVVLDLRFTYGIYGELRNAFYNILAAQMSFDFA